MGRQSPLKSEAVPNLTQSLHELGCRIRPASINDLNLAIDCYYSTPAVIGAGGALQSLGLRLPMPRPTVGFNQLRCRYDPDHSWRRVICTRKRVKFLIFN